MERKWAYNRLPEKQATFLAGKGEEGSRRSLWGLSYEFLRVRGGGGKNENKASGPLEYCGGGGGERDSVLVDKT